MKLIWAARIENPITKYPNKEEHGNTNTYHKRQNSPEIASIDFLGIPGMNRKLFLEFLNLVLFSKGFFPLCMRDYTKIIWIKNSDAIKLSNSRAPWKSQYSQQ